MLHLSKAAALRGHPASHHGLKPSPAVSQDGMPPRKTLHLLRHGQTEMNVYLEKYENDKNFHDPRLFDTVLTEAGKQAACNAADQAKTLLPVPTVLLSSPLTRALQTAEMAFPGFEGPQLAVDLARERTYFASDVGKLKTTLTEAWPCWSFKDVSEGFWWTSHAPGVTSGDQVVAESDGQFQQRLDRLRNYLANRPEECLALVAHRDVIENFIGRTPANCEFVTTEL